MIWFYLFMALITTDGKPGTVLPGIFTSLADCNTAGEAFAREVRAAPEIKQAGWFCQETDFDEVDPVPELPEGHPPISHTPRKNEI